MIPVSQHVHSPPHQITSTTANTANTVCTAGLKSARGALALTTYSSFTHFMCGKRRTQGFCAYTSFIHLAPGFYVFVLDLIQSPRTRVQMSWTSLFAHTRPIKHKRNFSVPPGHVCQISHLAPLHLINVLLSLRWCWCWCCHRHRPTGRWVTLCLQGNVVIEESEQNHMKSLINIVIL